MQAPGIESDSGLLNNTVSDAGNILDWTTRYADYESLLERLSGKAASVPVMATESNSVYTSRQTDDEPGERTVHCQLDRQPAG